MTMWSADPKEIDAALARIDPVFLRMPLRRSSELNRRFGAEFIFKDETANPIRSFKGRGACNFASKLDDGRPFVTASAGNFGQGLAWAARLASRSIVIFAATNAVPSKIEAMKRLGAEVILVGKDFDEAKTVAESYADERGALWVEDGAHVSIAEGAGTIALEALEKIGPINGMIVPLGNGALAAGVGCWLSHCMPKAAMIAVASTRAPAMALSVRDGKVITTAAATTIADGIAVRNPIGAAVQAVREVVDEVVLVEDAHIRSAMTTLREELGLIAEPPGAAGFAAILAQPDRWRDKVIVIPVCGANI